MQPSPRLRPRHRAIALLLSGILTVACAPTAHGRPYLDLRDDRDLGPDGIHVLDGSCVLDAGELRVNITNHGLIGSRFTETLPYSHAPSGEWPGGSGHEYLWGAGLWIGGKVRGAIGVTTGQPERELRPGDDITETIYEARDGRIVRPVRAAEKSGRRLPELPADDDGDGRMDEDVLNGRDDDGDGRIDEDFGQIGSQMFTCAMHDDLPLVRELYPDHLPLGLTVVQRASAWYQQEYEDIVAFDWEITNTGIDEVTDVFLGMYVDCDIMRRGDATQPDDLAGFYDGALRDDDGVYHRIQVGWMRDANPDAPLRGWFGTVLLGHDTDFYEYYAPRAVDVRAYRIFGTNARVEQDGEPRTDLDRYAAMSADRRDADRLPDEPGDLKYLMSWGPFDHLPPNRTLRCQVAFVVGNSQREMLDNAVKAASLFRGREFDVDRQQLTGYGGRETLVCLGDYPSYRDGSDPLYTYHASFADEYCIGTVHLLDNPNIGPEDFFTTPDGRECAYVNADNCDECFRALGEECTLENGLYWEFVERYRSGYWPSANDRFYTGVRGREVRHHWVYPGGYPPRPPAFRLVPEDNAVEVVWDDASEHDPDYDSGQLDFESYRVYRVSDWRQPPQTSLDFGPQSAAWGLIAEYDAIDTVDDGETRTPLGANTGLEDIRYRPVCLDDARYAPLAALMADFVAADTEGRYEAMPRLRDARGRPVPGLEAFIPWETEPAVLDTFFAVTPREAAGAGQVAKRAVRYYHYVDRDAKNGFLTFYSVVPTDHEMRWDEDTGAYRIAGLGVQADPGTSYLSVVPGPRAQTAAARAADGVNIYVYPNPATRASLAEMQQQPRTHDDPTGVRIVFNNLPRAHNVIRIFTASGDLLDTIHHDGFSEIGATTWNLLTRNGQEIVSGLYLYTVESDDDRFETFRGRFVVIR